ncbi:MAG: 4Fe-4S binding protein [Firmicutes bacterium]|nr:4Fe-4S binding protein [Bacillota bacterium]MDD4693072.1 4Fe-4S binding protein [Bacillota bacterium]
MKNFAEEYAKEKVVARRNLGVLEVDLIKIVGSVGRWRDFDRKFQLQTNHSPMRLRSIEAAMITGKELPPIELYKIKDDYYIVDGNHRVAAARRLGWKKIKARVTEYLPSADTPEGILTREQSYFSFKTSLADIKLTEIGHYQALLKEIENYREYMHERYKEEPTLKEAAKKWHDDVYLPLADIIEKEGLIDEFPGRTTSDLFLYIVEHKKRLTASEGREIPLIEALREFCVPSSKSLTQTIMDLFTKLTVSKQQCISCDRCIKVCPVDAIIKEDGVYHILEHCIRCNRCVPECPTDAIKPASGTANPSIMQEQQDRKQSEKK